MVCMDILCTFCKFFLPTLCLKKTGPLRIIWHNFTNWQRLLIMFSWERLYPILNRYDKFLNWFRTIATVVTWPTRKANFCADFEQRVIDRAINEWQNDCVPRCLCRGRKTSFDTFVIIFDTVHCSGRNTVCFKDLTFLFITQHTLEWRVVKDCYGNRFSWYTAVKTTVF